MVYIYHFLIIVCLLASIISALPLITWWVKGWNVGRVHLSWVMVILFIITLIFFSLSEIWVIVYLIALAIGVIYHVSRFHQFFPFHKVEVLSTTKRDLSLTFMTCNVREKNNDYQRFLELEKKIKPDLLLLTETNQAWLDATVHLKKQYPHVLFQPQENTYGMLFFSKFPIEKSEVKFLVEDDVPSFHTVLDLKGKKIQFFALHPRPPAPSNNSEHKDMELIMIAGASNENHLPTIVGGDLNDVGWSNITENFKQISGLLDPRIGRGFFNTYNALIPIFRFPVDHFFMSKHFKLLNIERLEKVGSDHFPVLVELNLEDD